MYLEHDLPAALCHHTGLLVLTPSVADGQDVWAVAPDAAVTNLATHLKPDGALSLREALKVFRQTAELLDFLHSHGILHGVLSPETVFIDAQGRCFLGTLPTPMSDTERLAQEASRRRWPAFVPPEIKAAQPVDSRADVYALGVLLHWLLTGETPGGASVSGKLPRRLAAILAEAVATVPEERLPTVTGFCDRLWGFGPEELLAMEQELKIARRSAGFDPRLLWVRHRRVVLGGAALLLLALALLGWGLWHYKEQQDARLAAEQQRREEQARIGLLKQRFQRGEELFARGSYVDALRCYQTLVTANTLLPHLIEPSLVQSARSYRELKDYGSEYSTWVRVLADFPHSASAGEANERLVGIAALTIAKYGPLKDITTENTVAVDGMKDDWIGIEPIIVDPAGDAQMGGAASDLVAFYMAVKADRLYLRFDTAGAPHAGDQYCVAFQLNTLGFSDDVATWDYQIGFSQSIIPWIWDLREGRTYENSASQKLSGVLFAQNECVEASFPLAAIGRPSSCGVRVFINYAGSRRPTDTCRSKVLVKWQLAPPVETTESLFPEGESRPAPAEARQKPEKEYGPKPRRKEPVASPGAGGKAQE